MRVNIPDQSRRQPRILGSGQLPCQATSPPRRARHPQFPYEYPRTSQTNPVSENISRIRLVLAFQFRTGKEHTKLAAPDRDGRPVFDACALGQAIVLITNIAL
jgi:hypothetical protein